MKLKKITSIKKKHYKGIVYDLTVEDNHSYNINGIIVHNSICSTRVNCGIGVPQLTAIHDCSQYKDGAYLIADGGIKNSGDIAKAMAAGADFCMCGSLLAGTNLAMGDCFDKDKNFLGEYNLIDPKEITYKAYRGMASREARNGVLNYASVEGVSGLVLYRGKTEDLLKDIELNLKASLSYLGVDNWKEMRRKGKFIRISNSSIIEGNTHIISK